MQIASEIALAGRRLSALEAKQFNLVNRVARSQDTLLQETLDLARAVAGKSPDATVVTRHGLREALEVASIERATQLTEEMYDEPLLNSPNRDIGLRAFQQKQQPQWRAPKL
jgi:enoyl-CoA hydratase/carnithine racemase